MKNGDNNIWMGIIIGIGLILAIFLISSQIHNSTYYAPIAPKIDTRITCEYMLHGEQHYEHKFDTWNDAKAFQEITNATDLKCD